MVSPKGLMRRVKRVGGGRGSESVKREGGELGISPLVGADVEAWGLKPMSKREHLNLLGGGKRFLLGGEGETRWSRGPEGRSPSP